MPLGNFLFVARMQDANNRIEHENATDSDTRMHGFCHQTRALFKQYGALHEWSAVTVHTKASWSQFIKRVKVTMKRQWQVALTQHTKSNLYLQMRTSNANHEVDGKSQLLRWHTQHYLSQGRGIERIGGQWKLRMRVFAVELNAIRVMERGRGLPPQAAKCNVCNSGDDESYYHFLFQCEGYNAIRVPMLQALQQEFGIIAWLLASSQ